MNSKRYFLCVISTTFVLLIVLALPTIIVDPYFHYGRPQGTYELNNQRYQNDGIAKHFEYDALIVGSSMIENFKTSEFDQLFGTTSIKLPYSGAHFSEIDSAINTALTSNDELKMVLRSIELDYVNLEKDSQRYDSYPTYLYDDNLLNDVSYVLNKEVLLDATRNASEWKRQNRESTSFDEYCSWEIETSLRSQIEVGSFVRNKQSETMSEFTDEDRARVLANIDKNIVQTVTDNPDVTFYLFFPPYSVVFFDSLIRAGDWEKHIEMQRCVIERLLQCENVKLFSYCNYYSITCDLEIYRDLVHYGPEINSFILREMKNNSGLLTSDNYMDYLNDMKEYYLSLDRDQYFEY